MQRLYMYYARNAGYIYDILTIRRSKSLDEEFGWQWLVFLRGIHNLIEKLGYVADVVQQETKPLRQGYF